METLRPQEQDTKPRSLDAGGRAAPPGEGLPAAPRPAPARERGLGPGPYCVQVAPSPNRAAQGLQRVGPGGSTCPSRLAEE